VAGAAPGLEFREVTAVRRAGRIAAAALGLTAGVWGQVPAPGDHVETLEWGGRTRSYIVHVPPGEARGPRAAVLVFHGGGGNARQAARMSGMSALAGREGFLAVYPNGTGRLGKWLLTWNSGYCCGYALRNRVDDVGFVRALITELIRRYGADPDRIYATGMSNGGMMTHRLAAELSDLLAGAAPVAGSIGGKANAKAPDYVIPRPGRPVPVLILHGKKDRHLRYEGGEPVITLTPGRVDLPVRAAVEFWVKNNGCAPEPVREWALEGHVERESYQGCRDGADVVLYTLIHGGHVWPGSKRPRLWTNDPCRKFPASETIWEFFAAHPRRRGKK